MNWSSRFRDAAPAALSMQESGRSAFAALVGLCLTALLSAAAWHGAPETLLVAPVAASAVILFALPHSPLGHPWAVFGGSLISAAIGLTSAALVPLPLAAGLLAVPLAVFAMARLRCLHPPAGAQALLFAMTGHALLAPLAMNLAALLAAATAINNLVHGRRYPLLPATSLRHTAGPGALSRTGIADADLKHAMERLDTYLDVSGDDLARIFDMATAHAFQRSTGLVCRHVMSRDVVAVALDTPLDAAWRLFGEHRVKALPVVDGAGRVAGVLTRSDFIRPVEAAGGARLAARLGEFLKARSPDGPRTFGSVADIMSADVMVAREDTPVMDMVETLCRGEHHHVPVVDGRRRLSGMVTQSDLLAALYHQCAWQARERTADALAGEPGAA